ncbi:MAG: hypothetical protein WBG63_03755 [Phormidesmis sp.]
MPSPWESQRLCLARSISPYRWLSVVEANTHRSTTDFLRSLQHT